MPLTMSEALRAAFEGKKVRHPEMPANGCMWYSANLAGFVFAIGDEPRSLQFWYICPADCRDDWEISTSSPSE